MAASDKYNKLPSLECMVPVLGRLGTKVVHPALGFLFVRFTAMGSMQAFWFFPLHVTAFPPLCRGSR